MTKTMFKDIADPKERIGLLRDNCDSVEETRYTRTLSQDELDVKRESLADNCIEKNRLEEELKRIKSTYKDQIDPITEDNKILCQQIKTRQAEFVGHVFYFADHESGMMNSYDENGELIASRRLKPEEKQAKLFISPAVNQ
jgi:hypothetical protein